MRVIEISDAIMAVSGTAVVPDTVSYVFNPNYVDISLGTASRVLNLAITDGVTTYDIEVSLFKGKAKCYISKLMQLFFTDYISERSKQLTIVLTTQNGDTILSEETMALWASVEQGKKFGYYHPFTYDRGKYPKYIREVIWFKNFPFRVSLFRKSASYSTYGRSDNNIVAPIFTGTEMVWDMQNSAANARRRAQRVFDEPEESITDKPATDVIDLGLLNEAGMEVDLEETGISDISQLSETALGDVVVRRKAQGIKARNSWDEDDEDIDWDLFWESGLDIINFVTLKAGKTGIFELSPITMFPETERKLVFTIMNTVPQNAKFDANFDIVFGEMTSVAYIVNLTVCEDRDGIYLRWIDQYGFWQYFLFAEGKRTSKNKLSSITVDAEYEQSGSYHEASRSIHVENADTIKCCAVNLREEILAYVETIYKSPHVEMYLGQDFEQNEMWRPVNIVSGTVEIDSNKRLFDYEVSITLPDTASQTI